MLEWVQNNLVVVISASIIFILAAILSLFRRAGDPGAEELEEKKKKRSDSSGAETEAESMEKPAKTGSRPELEKSSNAPRIKSGGEENAGEIAVEILGDLAIKEESTSGKTGKAVGDISVNRQEVEEIDLEIPEDIDLKLPENLGMQFMGGTEPEVIPGMKTPSAQHPEIKEIKPEPALDNEQTLQLPDPLDLEWPVEPDQDDEKTG